MLGEAKLYQVNWKELMIIEEVYKYIMQLKGYIYVCKNVHCIHIKSIYYDFRISSIIVLWSQNCNMLCLWNIQ